MVGDIENGHISAKLQSIALESMGIASPVISKRDLDSAYQRTFVAFNTLKCHLDEYRFRTDWNRTPSSQAASTQYDVFAVANWASQRPAILLNRENDAPLYIFAAQVMVAF